MLDKDCTTAAVWPQMAGTYKRTRRGVAGFPGAWGMGQGGHAGRRRYAGTFKRCSRISSRFPFTEATPNFFS
jgi:hypothetical protein